MQHSSAQMGVTAFAAVLHPPYVLQQNLSGFVFTFILKIALIKIASVCIIWLLRFSTGMCLPCWIDLKIVGYVSEAAEAPRLC